MIYTLLLAAGKSSRMGARDKLLEPIGGVPILQVLAERALCVGPVYITLPAHDHPRAAVVPAQVQRVIVDQDKGMAHSVKSGINALPRDASGVIILPADMPDITSDDLQKINDTAAATDAPIVRAETDDSRPGHPIYFAARQFPRFDSLNGDRGAFRLTTGLEDQTVLVPLAGDRARLDLDTPEDWAAYRAR